MPVGFKNGTSGNVQIAVDAVRSAAEPHRFLSVTKQGLAAIVATRGNQHCHVILRGGRSGPNFMPESVTEAASALAKANLRQAVMVDCSHANSQKDHKNQVKVAENLAAQVSAGSAGVFGVMIESNLVEGRQDVVAGKALTHGQSITDACLGFDQTRPVLELLASAVRARRKVQS
jgi:3-deoxy-7-phosphoheptulonate synthase